MKLIIALTLLITSAENFAQEMKELNKKFVSTLKDTEVQKQLEATDQFTKCRKDGQFDPKKNKDENEASVQKAVDCFKQQLGPSAKTPEMLKKMADALKLQEYGLIGSKTSQDISKYLSDKMYKAMTGVDRSTADFNALIESMKFKNRKMLDQKDFFELYMTQLSKNALFEISRYCFENFRLKDSTGTDFISHWKDTDFSKPGVVTLYTDIGTPKFGDFSNIDPKNKDAVYDSVYKSVSKENDLDTSRMGAYFTFCSSQIKNLCDSFEEAADKAKPNPKGEMTIGAQSCITQARLQSIRQAMSKTKIVNDDMLKLADTGSGIGLDKGDKVKFYDSTDKKNSFDSLTSRSSTEMLQGGNANSDELSKLEEQCLKSPGDPGCDKLLQVDDSVAKAGHQIDMEMRLKKEIEVERVKELKKKSAESLKEYLTSEGYLDILAEYEKDKKYNVEDAIGKAIDAKRIASLEGIKNKLGKRQLSETDAKDATLKAGAIKENIVFAKEERARLAQVVLFNNIITSNLELKIDKGGGKIEKAGRNINAWKKEEEDFKNLKVNPVLFSNLKKQVKEAEKENSSPTGSVVGLEMLDSILGAPQK